MTTPQGLLLADRHRVAQGQLAATAAQQILRVFPLLVAGGKVDENTPRWLQLVLAIIRGQRAQSAAIAAQFATAYRVVEHGNLDGFTPQAVLLDVDAAITTSLSVLGPTAYRREIARQVGVPPRELTPQALTETRLPPARQQAIAANVARAGMRHVQNAGRDTVDAVTKGDKAVIGYYRSTSATPCFFCAMLASRGPVYEEDSFEDSDPRFSGPGDQKVHDGCGCMLLPLYRRPRAGQDLGRYEEFDALWRANPSLLAFRRAYEGRAV